MEDESLVVCDVTQTEPDDAEDGAHRETERSHGDRAIGCEDSMVYVSCAENAEKLLSCADACFEYEEGGNVSEDAVCSAHKPHTYAHPENGEDEVFVTSVQRIRAYREADLHWDPHQADAGLSDPSVKRHRPIDEDNLLEARDHHRCEKPGENAHTLDRPPRFPEGGLVALVRGEFVRHHHPLQPRGA